MRAPIFISAPRRRAVSVFAAAVATALFWSPCAMSDPTTPDTTAQERAAGTFKVRIQAPQVMASPEGAPAQGRRALEKQYEGAMQGPSLGEMLAAGQPQKGEAAYVALESFTGTLNGRAGGFALAHLGLMHPGTQDLRIVIVPGSGTGSLQGISGEMTLRIEAGTHHYELRYRLPAAPAAASSPQ